MSRHARFVPELLLHWEASRLLAKVLMLEHSLHAVSEAENLDTHVRFEATCSHRQYTCPSAATEHMDRRDRQRRVPRRTRDLPSAKILVVQPQHHPRPLFDPCPQYEESTGHRCVSRTTDSVKLSGVHPHEGSRWVTARNGHAKAFALLC